MDDPSGAQQGGLVEQKATSRGLAAFKTGNDEIDSMPLTTQVWFNPPLMECVQSAALMMSKAQGFVPQFLLGKTETCFSVALTALDAGISPFFLAEGAFQTPEGKVGYDTRRIQAVVEAKNFFAKPPKLDYSGPWDGLIGKFKKEKSDKGKWYTVKTWTAADAKGCKLKVTFYFRDMAEPVECEEMDLSEVGTHFSTQWATEPKAQFARLVIRRQLNLKRASLMAGIPSIDDLMEQEQPMKDVSPPKDGNAGLDQFASPDPGETVVDDEPVNDGVDPEPQEDVDQTAPESDTQSQDSETVTLWVSPDEPARELASLSAAQHVMRCEIRDAPTKALATAIMNQNVDLISRIDNAAGDVKFSAAVEDLVSKKKDRKAKADDPAEDGRLV